MDDDARLRALAHGSRRRILRLVRDEGRSVGDLARQLGLTQPAVSQHLAVLRSSGLVEVEAEGRRRLYRADTEAVAEAGRFFAHYWDDATDRLVDAVLDGEDGERSAADGNVAAGATGVEHPRRDAS